MFLLSNLDLFAVGISIAGIAILGVVVYLNNSQNITNKAFLLLSLMASIHGIINYLSYQITTEIAIWLIRIVLFLAVWYAFSLFHFFYVFPNEKIKYSKNFKYILLPLVTIVSILTLTPLIFSKLSTSIIDSEVSRPEPGKAIFLFGILVTYLVIGGIIILIKKYLKSSKVQKKQYRFIIIGSLLAFPLYIIFNFIFTAYFEIVSYIPLAPVFIFPFIILTAYAILKHHLLNIKIIGTEILIFFISVFTLIEIIVATTLIEIIFRFLIFIILLLLGILIIKGIRKEIKQRIELQKLSDELYKVNKKLKKFDLQKTEFLSTTSHQLRTPLSGIKGYLSMMADGDFGPFSEEQSGIIKRVKAEVDRLVRMVQDFLNVSRIESGRLELNMTEFNIVDLVKTVIEELGPSAKNRGLEIDLDTTKDNIKIKADPDKLKDVIVNLTDNAIKYTEQGKVSVGISCAPNKQVKVAFHDTGVGVDPEEIGKLFVKFQRAKDIARVSPSGTGLGLFVAKKIIGAHNGEIWAESKGKGQGSTFIFKIPSNC